MTDTLSPAQRSERMGRIRAKNTKPELYVRRLLHSMGYRYRLHSRKLPGKPDLVFPSRHKVVFVHGCFWHHHPDPSCRRARLPKSREEYWRTKLEGNCARDLKNLQELEAQGWTALVLWECELRDEKALRRRLQDFLA